MVSNTTHKRKPRQIAVNNNNKQFIDFIEEDNNVPFSNRFHLSAARSDFQNILENTSPSLKAEFASIPAFTTSDNKLVYLEDQTLLQQFRTNKTKRRIVISDSTYDDAMLWRIHDVYRTDGAVSRSIDTLVKFTVGRKRTSLVLDTNDYYDSDEQENEELQVIQQNELYRKYVR